MRHRLALLHGVLLLVAALVLAGCPTDKGARSALSTTTTRGGPPTTAPPGGGGSTVPGSPGGGEPGGPGTGPGGGGAIDPGELPGYVVVGGTKLLAVSTTSGQTLDIPRPPLGNGLQAIGLLERDQGLVTVVRGPLPQDPGAVSILGDVAHEPRSLGTGVSVVAGATGHELWIADAATGDGLTPVRRADVGREVPDLVQRLPRGRTLLGVAGGGLVLGVLPDADGEVVGPVDLMDPVKGSLSRHLADSGYVVAADGQRAAIVVDGACTTQCRLTVVGPTTDRAYDLPPDLVPEPGGVTSAGVIVFVGRVDGGPRHLWVLSLTDGQVRDTGLTLPPGAGPAPMAIDAQGAWAFTRSGPSTIVAVRTATAEAQELPWRLEPWNAIAVTAGGTCPCAPAGGSGPPPV